MKTTETDQNEINARNALEKRLLAPALSPVVDIIGQLGRKFVLIDNNPEALEVMRQRLAKIPDLEIVEE